MPSIETVSILISDLVGSTGLASRVGPAAADELRREHFSALREAIEETGGREVKNTGDGVMAVFESASAGVACGVAMQQRLEQRNRHAEEQLTIRVGVSLGDATVEEGDYFGMPSVEAARLCDRAAGGQILTTELVRMICARGEHNFVPMGELDLKGIPEPVASFEVSWEPTGAAAGSTPLPSRLHGVPPLGYVGREREREHIAALADAAGAGMRQVLLISGEPGIGKTRLSTHAALELHGEGAMVLYGHCDEELGVPYGPWVHALSHYVEHAPEKELVAYVERQGGDLGRLLPALRRRLPDLPPATETDPETERYLLFAAVAALLQHACSERPVVLLLDDLHWADKPTLALLRHVVAESATVRLLLLGTYRESDLTQSHPLTDTLADLRREPGVERLQLDGLNEGDVAAIMQAAGGQQLEETGLALAREIAAETDGNAFFVAEMLRHLTESGALAQGEDGRWELKRELSDLGLPQSVREVVGRRIERLGETSRGLLRCAAVIGRDFEVELLVRIAREDEEEVLDLLEAAVEASVLMERAEPGTFSFAHGLINHTLYEEVGVTRRARMHRRVAEALEEWYGDEPAEHVAALARHWSAATAPVDADKAIRYNRQAGERALAELAPDEAMRWFAQALELLEKVPDSNPTERCELLIGLGEAQRQTGEPAFRETLLEAARVAEELGNADLMAGAALSNNRGVTSNLGEVDQERVAVLERAIELDGRAKPGRRARLLSLQAMELVFESGHERRRALAEEALTLAREAGDERTLAYVLRDYWIASWSAETLERRREVAAELDTYASRLNDPLLEIAALYTGVNAAMEAGALGEAAVMLDRWLALTDRLGQPGLRWFATYQAATFALLRGDLEEAERRSQEAAELGNDAGSPDTFVVYAGQFGELRWLQGRSDEIVELVEQAAEINAAIPAFRSGLAVILADLGRVDEAREIVLAGAEQGFANIPRDQALLTTLAFYARAAAQVGVPEVAQPLYEAFAPFRERMICNGVTAHGPCEPYLGALAALQGRHEVADEHFAAASAVNEGGGLHAWEAHNQMLWARALMDRGEPEAAREHAERASGLATEHGHAEVARYSAELLAVAR